MNEVFDPKFPKNVSRTSESAVSRINVPRQAIIDAALQRTRILTDEESRKNVPFDYRGIGITNADSESIKELSFTTHVNDQPVGLTTLRVDFRDRSAKCWDGSPLEVTTRIFRDIPIDLCELMLADPSLFHSFVENGFVSGEPEIYKGFQIFWSGWKPFKNGTELIGQWIALTPDGKRRAYSSVPGGTAFYELGEEFDIEPKTGQKPVSLGINATNFYGEPDKATEAAMADAHERLLALLLTDSLKV